MSGRSWGGWLCLCIAFGSLTLLARLIGAPTGRRVAYLSAAGVADDRQQNGSTAADDSSQPAREVHVFTPPPPINPLLPRIWFDIVLRNSSTDDPKHPKHSGYQQPLVALGEGLQQLGVYFRASSDYWEDQFHGGHLFRAAARHEPPESFDVLVSTWMRPAPLDSRDGSFRDLPAPFFVPASRRSYLTAMIDWRLGDPLKSHYLERLAPLFDIYMRAHWSDYNTPRPLPSGLQPSAFYLTRRILHTLGGLTRTLDPVPASGGTGGNSGRSSGRASDHGDHVGAESDHGVDVAATSRIARDTRILWPHCNFISMGHTVRREAYERIYSRLLRLCQRTDQLGGRKLAPAGTLERRFWEQTGGRHNAYYFKSLLRFAAIDVSGGYFYTPRHAPPGAPQRAIMQWESFKLWEAFAAGTTVLMPRLESFGMRLPVMPTPWVHYVPISFEAADIDRLVSDLQAGAVNLSKVGREGQRWALEHYTPLAYAKRFVAEVAKLTGATYRGQAVAKV